MGETAKGRGNTMGFTGRVGLGAHRTYETSVTGFPLFPCAP